MSEIVRVYHKWDEWECYPAGFYDEKAPRGLTKDEAEEAYREFLADPKIFEWVAMKVISEWKNSTEHHLTNISMNRVAWIGQASACYHLGLPCKFRNGYNKLPEEQQAIANEIAERAINAWLQSNGYEENDSEGLQSKSVANLY